MLLQKGADIEIVAELIWNTAISITQMYMHSEVKIKTKSVNKLNSILNWVGNESGIKKKQGVLKPMICLVF